MSSIMAFDQTISEFKPVSRTPMAFKEEASNTARYIRNATDKEIIIGLSGGIDSEATCRAFIDAGIEFSVLIVKHLNDKNQHDIIRAFDFCKQQGIKNIYIHEIDIEKFINFDLDAYILDGYKTSRIYIFYQLYMLNTIEDLCGCAVLGNGKLRFSSVDNKTYIAFNKDIFIPVEFCHRHDMIHFPYFFMSTPGIIASYLNVDIVQYLTNDSSYFNIDPSKTVDVDNSFIDEKSLVFHAAWPEMSRRHKYDGFENVRSLFNSTQQKLSKTYSKQYISIEIAQARKQLGLTG